MIATVSTGYESSKNFSAKIENSFLTFKEKCLTWDNRTTTEMTQLFFFLPFRRVSLWEERKSRGVPTADSFFFLYRQINFWAFFLLPGYTCVVFIYCYSSWLLFECLAPSYYIFKRKKKKLFLVLHVQKGGETSRQTMWVNNWFHVKIFFMCFISIWDSSWISRWDISAVYPFRDVWLFVVSKINQPINDMQHTHFVLKRRLQKSRCYYLLLYYTWIIIFVK
jgi:hypothetical protein